LSTRLGVPDHTTELAKKVTKYHLNAHRSLEIKPGKIVNLLENIGAFKEPEILEQFVTAVQADAQGRLGREDTPYPQASFLRSAFRVTKDIDDNVNKEYSPEVRRIEAIADLKRELNL
jgi:tRNA nucleotidyltransferase (CCA-adding enzyme)